MTTSSSALTCVLSHPRHSFIVGCLKVRSLQPGKLAIPISFFTWTVSTKHSSVSTALPASLPMNFPGIRQRECRFASHAAQPYGLINRLRQRLNTSAAKMPSAFLNLRHCAEETSPQLPSNAG